MVILEVHDLGIIYTWRWIAIKCGNKLFIWDESENSFALVSADVSGSADPSVDFSGNYAPMHMSDLSANQGIFASDVNISGSVSVNGSLLSVNGGYIN